MTDKETIRTSKFLSLILRHEPEWAGLKLGEAGWVNVDELLRAVNSHGVALTLDQLKHIVATSDKKRFAFSEDGLRIRASQGHSVEIDLQYPPQTPPEICTTARLFDFSTVSGSTGCRRWSDTMFTCQRRRRSPFRSVVATASLRC